MNIMNITALAPEEKDLEILTIQKMTASPERQNGVSLFDD
jgi:hypothetical protein